MLNSAMYAKQKVTADLPVWSTSPEAAEVLIRDLMQTFRHIHLKVKGTCMSQAMKPGTRVTVSPTQLKPPRIGDVVLVRHPHGLKLHRVFWGPPLAPATSFWRTRGDQSAGWDPWVKTDSILGTVVSISGAPGQRVRFGLHELFLNFTIGFMKTIRFQVKNLIK